MRTNDPTRRAFVLVFALAAVVTACSRHDAPPVTTGVDAAPERRPEPHDAHDASPASTLPPDAAPLPPHPAAEDYDGQIGDAIVAVHLAWHGDDLSGHYVYLAYGRPIALEGHADGGEVTLSESVSGKTTGHFSLRQATSGDLAGTWTSLAGDKTANVDLRLDDTPLVVVSRLPFSKPTVSGTPIAPLDRARFLDAAMRLNHVIPLPANVESTTAGMHGHFLRAELDGALEAQREGGGFCANSADAAARFSDVFLGGCVSAYLADVNNDGTEDYVFVSENGTISHGSSVDGVFDVEGDAFREIAWYPASWLGICDGCFPMQVDEPFLVRTPSGTTMRFLDYWGINKSGSPGAGAACLDCCGTYEGRYVYLWKGAAFRVVQHERYVYPCR